MKLTKEIIKEMVNQVLSEEQESMLLESPETEKEVLEESDEGKSEKYLLIRRRDRASRLH